VSILYAPTIALALVAKEAIRPSSAGVNRDRGTTFILTTHDLAGVERLCRRIVLIDRGTLIFDGEIERLRLPARCRQIGLGLAARMDAISNQSNVMDVRGRGLMWGIELKDGPTAAAIIKGGLKKGLILLQAGERGNVISITPPLTITEKQLYRAIDLLEEVLKDAVAV